MKRLRSEFDPNALVRRISLIVPLPYPITVCSDGNAYCPSWASKGECTRNWSYMSVYCRASCGLCLGGNSANSNCTNNNTYCNAWAKNGECTKNSNYMLKDCKKACDAC